jgi:hypothetical protein
VDVLLERVRRLLLEAEDAVAAYGPTEQVERIVGKIGRAIDLALQGSQKTV